MFIDRESPIPAHYQLKQILLQQVQKGVWPLAAQIPSEAEICAEYRVSRTTVRQAIQALVQDGVLLRRQGVGTFVSHLKLEEDLSRLLGFSEDMERHGLKPGARLLSAEMVIAPVSIVERLALVEDATVFRVERVRLADDIPIAHEITFWRNDVGRRLQGENLENAPLYQIVEQKYGFKLAGATQSISAGLPNAVQVECLRIHRDTPVLFIERVTIDGDNRPIELCHNTYRSDRYRYSVYLKRHS